jgi:hypothetical protein
MSLLYSVTHSSHAARVLLNSTAATALTASRGCCDGTACGSSSKQQQQQQCCSSVAVSGSAQSAPLDSVNSSDAVESSLVVVPDADISCKNSSSEECPEMIVPEPAGTYCSNGTAADNSYITSVTCSGSALTQHLSTSSSSSSGSTSMWMNFGLWRRRPCGGIPTYTQVCILHNTLTVLLCNASLHTLLCCLIAPNAYTLTMAGLAPLSAALLR